MESNGKIALAALIGFCTQMSASRAGCAPKSTSFIIAGETVGSSFVISVRSFASRQFSSDLTENCGHNIGKGWGAVVCRDCSLSTAAGQYVL